MSYNSDLVNDQLNKIVELFNSKDVSNLKDTIKKAYIEGFDKPCHNWSLGNQILIYMQGTKDARTINQWNKEGRYIKKGSKALYILAPLQKKIQSKNKGTGLMEDIFILNGFRTHPVFKIEDTYGTAIRKFEPKKQLALKEVAEKWDLKIEYDSTSHGEYGSFNPTSNIITLCTEDQTTFFHELAHKAHSKLEPLKLAQDPEQETIAQLTACVLGSVYGFEVMGYTYDYISSYVGSKDPLVVGKMCLRVLNKVQKILNMILDESTSINNNKVLCEVKN